MTILTSLCKQSTIAPAEVFWRVDQWRLLPVKIDEPAQTAVLPSHTQLAAMGSQHDPEMG